MRSRILADAACLATLVAFPALSAPLCPGLRGVKPAPPALQASVAEAFGLAPEVARNAMIRCVGDTLMACTVGANLNCGKANARRALPGATAYCRDNPDSDFIPMFATGHATIYDWRCSAGKAVPGKVVVTVDRQGFDAGTERKFADPRRSQPPAKPRTAPAAARVATTASGGMRHATSAVNPPPAIAKSSGLWTEVVQTGS